MRGNMKNSTYVTLFNTCKYGGKTCLFATKKVLWYSSICHTPLYLSIYFDVVAVFTNLLQNKVWYKIEWHCQSHRSTLLLAMDSNTELLSLKIDLRWLPGLSCIFQISPSTRSHTLNYTCNIENCPVLPFILQVWFILSIDSLATQIIWLCHKKCTKWWNKLPTTLWLCVDIPHGFYQ